MPNQSSPGFDPPEAFWREYLRENPLDRPATIRRPFAGPVVSAHEIFEVLVAAADRVRRGIPCQLRIYLGDRAMVWRQTSDQLGDRFGEVLPVAGDGSLEGFRRRLRAEHGYECFALLLNESQTVMPEIWFRVRGFLRDLYRLGGFPMGGADANIFTGNYRRTPFGVHTDDRDVFTCVVEGRKTFRAWPRETFPRGFGKNDAEAHDYAAHLDRAVTLEGDAGDLLYWPEPYWHVAESDEEGLVTTLSIGLARRLDTDGWVREALSEARNDGTAQERQGFSPAQIERSVRELPPALACSLDILRGRSASAEIDRALRLRWLSHLTAFGMQVPPPAEVPELSQDEFVQCDGRYPILCVPWRGDLLCSANGHGFWTARRKVIIALVRALNSGSPLLVRDLCERFAVHLPPSELLALLRRFASYRALERAGA